MAHKLTVRPCECAVYFPTLSKAEEEHIGQRLPCTIWSVTEVWAITEETLAVRALGLAMLAPHTITQVQVAVLALRPGETAMIKTLLQAVLYLTYVSFTTAFTDNTLCPIVAITANIVMSSVFVSSAV